MQNNLNELLIQSGYCACMPSRNLDFPVQEGGPKIFENQLLNCEKGEENNKNTLNQLSYELMKPEGTFDLKNNNFSNLKYFRTSTESELVNLAYNEGPIDFEHKEEEYEPISEEDIVKIKPKIDSVGRIKLNSDDCINVRNLQTLKSMIGINSNLFSVNCEEADSKNPSKVINPNGMALQITTSDIPTIKSIMQFAAENNQEITVVIPMRKTKNVTACPHYDRKHYAKNMCSACYNKNGRTKKAWACGHPDKVHYAKGLCQFCYLAKYHKENAANK